MPIDTTTLPQNKATVLPNGAIYNSSGADLYVPSTPVAKKPVGSLSTVTGAENLNTQKQRFDALTAPQSELQLKPGEKPEEYAKRTGYLEKTPVVDKPADYTFLDEATGAEYTNPSADLVNSKDLKFSGGTAPSWYEQNATLRDANNKKALAEAENAKLQATILDFTTQLDKFKSENDTIYNDQIENIKKQFAVRETAMKDVNNRRVQTLQTGGFRSGAMRYGSETFGGIITEEERQGVARLSEIDAQKATALGAAQTAWQTQNWNIFDKKMAVIDSLQQSKQKEIENLNKTITDENNRIADLKKAQDAEQSKIADDIRRLMDNASKTGGLTTEKLIEMDKALANGDFSAAIYAAGDSLTNVGGWMGEWYSYKNTMETQYPGVKIMNPQEFKNWDDNNKAAIARAGVSSGYGSGGATEGVAVPFQATIDRALDLVGPTIKRSLKNDFYALAQRGDYDSLLKGIQNQTINQFSAANKTKIENAQVSLPYLTELSIRLQEFKDAGGDTNLISGTENQIANKLGVLSKKDPKFATIAAQLQGLFFNYRRDMSGAAFSVPESSSYQSINPSMSNTLSLNMALIQGLKNANENQIDSAFSSKLPSGAYKNLKSKADQQLYKSGSAVDSSNQILIAPLKRAEDAIVTFGSNPKNRKQVNKLMKDNPDAGPEEIATALNLKY